MTSKLTKVLSASQANCDLRRQIDEQQKLLEKYKERLNKCITMSKKLLIEKVNLSPTLWKEYANAVLCAALILWWSAEHPGKTGMSGEEHAGQTSFGPFHHRETWSFIYRTVDWWICLPESSEVMRPKFLIEPIALNISIGSRTKLSPPPVNVAALNAQDFLLIFLRQQEWINQQREDIERQRKLLAKRKPPSSSNSQALTANSEPKQRKTKAMNGAENDPFLKPTLPQL